MNERKIFTKAFLLPDYLEEEKWLCEQEKAGWRLVKMIPPCFYVFASCKPADVVYQLDFEDNKDGDAYHQMLRDYGWEYVTRCNGWLYFRKPAEKITREEDGRLFSDRESRILMIDRIVKTRLLPLCAVFCLVLIPCLFLMLRIQDPLSTAIAVILGLLFLLYVYVILYCFLRLRKLKRDCVSG